LVGHLLGRCPHPNLTLDEKRLDIRLDFPRGSTFSCPKCEQSGLKAFDTVEKTWRHLNFFQHEAYLTVSVPRTKCDNYVSLFVNLGGTRVLFATDGKAASTVKRFKQDLIEHKGDPKAIKAMCCDMSPAFISGVEKQFPEAHLTFDRFHVMKAINDAVDKVRREEIKDRPDLKKSRVPATREDAEAFLKKWYFWATHSRLEPIKEAAYTIKRHWNGVLRWFTSKINNGILEGINSLIQAAKAKARGCPTKRNLITMIYLIAGKLSFDLPT
jgi:transposase